MNGINFPVVQSWKNLLQNFATLQVLKMKFFKFFVSILVKVKVFFSSSNSLILVKV